MATLSYSIEEQAQIDLAFNDLLNYCRSCKNEAKKKLIVRAFIFARKAHDGVRRHSGEPYILHPLAVARIVSEEIGLGTTSIICALLHDVVEDTEYTLEDIENLFGKEVAYIIDGLTKINKDVIDITEQQSQQAANFRKIILTMSDDIRAVLVKIADRLHNMRTLEHLPLRKQMKAAGETLYVYAPLANRMGLYKIKVELEDLCLKYRHPDVYAEILRKLQTTEDKRNNVINKFSLVIYDKLYKQGIDCEISGRSKSIFSIWNKMQNKAVAYEEIYDVFAMRIIFDSASRESEAVECWKIYSIIAETFPHRNDRLRDWISAPKSNGYEALHATFMGPYGAWVEVQIRSRRMNEIAEFGIAAHWKYKGANDKRSIVDNWLKDVKFELSNFQTDGVEFVDNFRLNFLTSEIMVFTPKGKIITLPSESTIIDFAFEIHTDLAFRCIGAKVNTKLVPTNYVLKSGDQVEILTSKNQKPDGEWLNFVKTPRAKLKLKEALKGDRKMLIQQGKVQFDSVLKDLQIKPSSNLFIKIHKSFPYSNRDELYAKIGENKLDKNTLVDILSKRSKFKSAIFWGVKFILPDRRKVEMKSNNVGSILNELHQNVNYTLAKCCMPIPGDQIMGYKGTNGEIVVHKASCKNTIKLDATYSDQMVYVKWESMKKEAFLSRIKFNGIDEMGIVHSITGIISKELNVNMRSIHVESNDGIFDGTIDLYVYNSDDLDNLIANLRKLKPVKHVNRIEGVELE